VLQGFRPDLVLYDARVDVHEADDLGKLGVSVDGLRRRELLVLDSCLAAGVPVAGYVGGGYAANLDVLADRHIWLHAAAAEMWLDHGL
jgi:acetoin utilization deacetylase AcuC-like enzyme